jgi:outer membrane murein-binding lipoprotein Lpp
MKKEMIGICIGIVLLAGIAVAGCTQQPTSQQAEAQLCQDMADLDQAIKEVEAIKRDSTVGDLRAAENNVTMAMENIRTSAKDLKSARVTELETAYTNLENAVRSIPEGATVGEGLTSITEERIAFRQAWNNLFDELKCTP